MLVTDKSLLSQIGVSDGVLGSLVGKSRQAVNYGIGSQERYLKPHELSVLLLHCRTNRPGVVEIVEDYVRQTRPNEADDILAAYDVYVRPERILTADEVWGVFADFRYFAHTNPADAELVLRLAASAKHFVLVTADSREAERFWSDAERVRNKPPEFWEARKAMTRIVSEANAFPHCLFTEPSSSLRAGFVHVRGGFQEIDGMRTGEMLRFLKLRPAAAAAGPAAPIAA